MDKKKRIQELVELLNKASKAYYAEDREIMSNYEYDAFYDELVALEQETGMVMANSPTVNVGYEAVDELPKEQHEAAMLSLDKTKDREVLRAFMGGNKTLLSWKMDGLTIVLTYRNGQLEKAVTRGRGLVGEVVTNNARVFDNLPLRIPYQGELILRGEAVITYSDFEKINEKIQDVDARYKNPRNLCSGSVRQLNNQITAERHVQFYAFALVKAEGVDFENSREVQLQWLSSQGFSIVEYRAVTGETLDEAMDYFASAVQTNDFPSDGLVALYDDIAYGESLGTTAKFPRNAFAFKWADETRETHLLEIEWSPSRTGLINPVAIFEPVELEGTTVSRASVHNVSILKELQLGIGDEILVYKANMIIPQIAENRTRSGSLQIPDTCPACGGKTEIRSENDVETLMCLNPDCPAKTIKAFSLFVSRDALNMDGISENTLEKFISKGLLSDFSDLFRLDQHRDTILAMEGFKEKSYENILESIRKSSETTPERVLYALGIPGIGVTTAKLITRAAKGDLEKISHMDEEELSMIEGIGPVLASGFVSWWQQEKNRRIYQRLMEVLTVTYTATEQGELPLADQVFVITGSVHHFANRNELKARIEELGGKVTGSVSKKTNYLINNDVTSASSKNKKARELGIPILSEEDFLKLLEDAGEM
ncbi:MAG: NAD-dependent DNA ligase LigA [Lachnospiraceae bacterium]|nr:NAD-dependent DNA ligase LigA [Lachnospiraceae bacterium]